MGASLPVHHIPYKLPPALKQRERGAVKRLVIDRAKGGDMHTCDVVVPYCACAHLSSRGNCTGADAVMR
jgi:hypothetical protein